MIFETWKLVTEEDIARLSDQEFEELWRLLGVVARKKADRLKPVRRAGEHHD